MIHFKNWFRLPGFSAGRLCGIRDARKIRAVGANLLLLAAGVVCYASVARAADHPAPPHIHLAPVEDLLARMAKSPHPSLRAAAIESIQGLKTRTADQIIASGLKDANSMVRFSAAIVAGKRRLATVRTELDHLLADPDKSVRVAAIYALARLGHTSHMDELAQTLQSNSPTVRANTAFVLGRLGDTSAIVLLKTGVDDPNSAVRMAITSALARLGDRRAINSLIAMSLSKYAQFHLAAMSTCRSLQNPLAANVLLNGLHDPLIAAQLIAARGLGQRNSTLGEKISLTCAVDKNPQLRVLAALALGSIPVAYNAHVLEKLLKDPDPKVEIAAAAGLIELHHLANLAKRH